MEERRLGHLWRRRVSRRGVVRGAAVGGAAVGLAGLAGCGSSGGTTAGGGAPTAGATAAPVLATAALKAKYGGAFRVGEQATDEPPNLDVHQAIQFGLHVWGVAVAYSKVLQFRTDVDPAERIPTGDLAETWEQPDDTIYLFKLRRNAKFHNIAPVNGRPVVAEDIKYSFERQIALKTNASGLAGVTKIEVVDPQTVKIVLDKSDADFLITLADTRNKIVPRESVEVRGDLKEGPIIGSGPWIFDRYEKGTIAALARNPDYFMKGLPYLDRLEFPRVADVSTLTSAFRAQQLDIIPAGNVSPKDAETILKTSPDIRQESFKAPQGIVLAMNTTKPPFDDLRVRQAIFKAINKQGIMEAVYGGQAWYYPGVRMNQAEWYLPEDEVRTLYKQDVDGARRLLAEARVGSGLDFELLVLNLGTTYLDAAQLVKEDLAAIGITLRIKPVDAATWVAAVYQNGTHEITISGTTPVVSTNGDLFNVHHSKGTRSWAKLSDPKLDAMIEQQATMGRDPAGRKKLLQDIQRSILNSAHHFHLAGVVALALRWKYVQDFFPATPGLEEAFARVWLDK